ncbi:MAG: hypothetical protein IKS48_10195 [Eubacterium sp.]|nr:hypothetical protein [Eubacterium sp.]
MQDWNHDGDQDYWDDIYFQENIERDDQTDKYSLPIGSKKHRSTGFPFLVRMIVVSLVVGIIGIFNELVGVIILILWVIYEIYN